MIYQGGEKLSLNSSSVSLIGFTIFTFSYFYFYNISLGPFAADKVRSPGLLIPDPFPFLVMNILL